MSVYKDFGRVAGFKPQPFIIRDGIYLSHEIMEGDVASLSVKDVVILSVPRLADAWRQTKKRVNRVRERSPRCHFREDESHHHMPVTWSG
jgi:hypothetical protein